MLKSLLRLVYAICRFSKCEKALDKELAQWSERQPNKPIMFTEYGADTVAGMHAIDDQMFTEEYQLNYYKSEP